MRDRGRLRPGEAHPEFDRPEAERYCERVKEEVLAISHDVECKRAEPQGDVDQRLWESHMSGVRCVVLMIATVLGICCGAEETGPASAEPMDVRQELLQRIRDYEQALLDGDPMAVKGFWTEDARVLLPGLSLEGDALASFVDQFYAGGGRVLSVKFQPREVFVHGDAAYDLGRLEETARFGGHEPEAVRENYFLRWERGADGSWRIDRFLAVPVDAHGGE